jgi:hypothetical protein
VKGIIPFQLLLVVSVLRVIRRMRPSGVTESWLRLTGKVFLLMLAVNIVALVPGIGIAAVIVWLVGLGRLSGFDVLSTFILSFTLGVVNLAAMAVLARHLEISFLWQWFADAAPHAAGHVCFREFTGPCPAPQVGFVD